MPKKYEPPDPRRSHSIMTQEEANSGKPTRWTALELFGGIRHLSSSLFSLTYLTALHASKNCLSVLPPDVSRLQNLAFLDVSNNAIEELPKELGHLTNLRELNLANNKLRTLPYELGRLFLLQRFSLEGNPLSPEFAGHAKDPSGTVKLLTFLLDNLQVSSLPPPRDWVNVPRPDNGGTYTLSGETFSVMSYNVLCDKYSTRQLYGYCPSWALAWTFRRDLIVKEIQKYNSDIVSLQEVETEQFHNFFQPKMRTFGYEGIFNSKSRARTMTEMERKSVDGCAIFFKSSRFRLIREVLVEFNQLAALYSEGADDMLNRVMTKDNIGIVAALEVKNLCAQASRSFSTPPILMVANAHIHWDPEYCDVKLIQTIMMVNELEQVIETVAREQKLSMAFTPAQQIPLIVCGDLNSLPDSGVIEFLTKGHVSTEHADFLGKAYDGFLARLSGPVVSPDRIRGIAGGNSSISHSLKLTRSYDGPRSLPFTNKTYDFVGTIDYVFHTRGLLEVQKVLGTCSLEWLEQNRIIGFPHPHFPSDHIPLVVNFELAVPTL